MNPSLELSNSEAKEDTMTDNPQFSPMFEKKEAPSFHGWKMNEQEPEVVESIVEDSGPSIEEECQVLKEQAYQEGFAKGLQDAKQQMAPIVQGFRDKIQSLQKPLEQLDNKVDQDVVQAVFHICKSCLDIELSVTPEHLLRVWQAIKYQLPSIQETPCIKMCEEDLKWLQGQLTDEEDKDILSHTRVESQLRSGDFLLSYDSGEVDGRMSQRIKSIVQAEFEDIVWDNEA